MIPLLQQSVRVQTSRGLGQTWTDQPWLIARTWEDGQGQFVGTATLEQDYGIRTIVGGSSLLQVGIAPNITGGTDPAPELVGQCVRIVLDYDDTPLWHGVIRGPARDADGHPTVTGGTITWQCVGLADVLDTVVIASGAVARGTGWIDPGFCPPFNAFTGGDRAVADTTLSPFGAFKIHDFDTVTRTVWTAGDIVRLLLGYHCRIGIVGDAASRGGLQGWAWVLDDPSDCLEYLPGRVDLTGETVLDALNALISPRRALTWYLTVSGDTATIHVRSTSRTGLPGPTYDLPAATETTTLQPIGDNTILDVRIDEDASAVADQIIVEGDRPILAMTVRLGGTDVATDGVVRGWTSTEETRWAALKTSAGNPVAPEVENVWRQWQICSRTVGGNTWAGNVLDSTDRGLANYFPTDADGGVTGEREYQSIALIAPQLGAAVALVRGDGSLPCGVGFSADLTRPRQQPVLVLGNAGADYFANIGQGLITIGTNWSANAAWLPLKDARWTVTVDDGGDSGRPPVLVLDDGQNGVAVYNALATAGGSALLYATIGLRDVRPLRVSWVRPQGQWPNAYPRTIRRTIPSAQLHLIPAGVVTGCNDDGTALTTQATDLIVRDDRNRLTDLLTLLKQWHGEPARTVTWTIQGSPTYGSAWRPGTLLTDLILASGPLPINAVISRRRVYQQDVDGVPVWFTQFTTERPAIDVESLL
jgi:hypothetical protein